MSVEGINDVKKALEKAATKYGENPQVAVVVGYNAAYALHVHENIEMKWRGKKRPSGLGVYWGPAGQAKFLEQPARELGYELGQMILRAMKNGAKLLQALTIAGLRLQKESQKLVPIEYGNLRGSAFTEQDTGKSATVVGTVK